MRAAKAILILIAFVAFAPLAKAQNVGFVQDVANRINPPRSRRRSYPAG